jgi:Nucleotidyltransferase of unknown function (DUF6036)
MERWPLYTPTMRPEDLLRWLESRRAAERREKLETRQAGPDSAAAIRSALALAALARRLHGWPLPETPWRGTGGIGYALFMASREEPEDRGLLEALEALAAALRQIKAPGMIIGGIAVIARGVPRLTVDADATVWGEEVDLDELVQILGRHQIVPRIPDALHFARQRQVLLLRHEPSGTPIEVSIAWLPFEREALEKATPIQFSGIEIPVATAEDLVIYKALAWRDQDRSDIERLIVLHGKTMNLKRIQSFVEEFAEILEDPHRAQEFKELLGRAMGSK